MFFRSSRSAFTLIELLVVIAIIAILAVVVVLTLNPAELLRQSRDANRVSDMATLTSALNLYTTDVAGSPSFNMGLASDTYVSVFDSAATSTNACPSLGLPALNASSGQAYLCSASSSYRNISSTGWIPVNLNNISAGTPIGNLPIDPTNQTSTGLFYVYNTNGTQFEATADLESSKYKSTYANTPQTSNFPEVISGGTQNVSALYNNSGLIGYWAMDEGSGSSTIDQSGNGNTGTWSGASGGTGGTHYNAGKVGTYAGNFNGSNDIVNLGNPSALNVTSSITIAAWVQSNNASNGFGEVVVKQYDGSNPVPYSLNIYNDGSTGGFSFHSGGWHKSGVGTSIAGDGLWHFVVGTYDGLTLSYYVDGSLKSSASFTGSLPVDAQPVYIGEYANNNFYFSGNIDEVRIYNRALSPAEIISLYNAEK